MGARRSGGESWREFERAFGEFDNTCGASGTLHPVIAISRIGQGSPCMNFVAFALRRPISVLVLVIAALITGIIALQRMPRDIFPDLGVPTLYVAQPYGGMDPAQM